jgi:protein-tyrosine phosphatase
MKRIFLPLLALPLLTAAAPPPAITAADVRWNAGSYDVTWTTAKPGAPVDVFVSADPLAPRGKMKKLADDDTDGKESFRDPLGAGVRPYFFVQADKAPTGVRIATRVIPLTGASNFRDVGGYPAASGNRVKWGQIFRANALSGLTADDYKTVDSLGIRLVCDLRTDEERLSQPTKWQGKPPAFLNSPKANLDFDAGALLGDGQPTAAKVRENFIAFYRQTPKVYAAEYKAMFTRLKAGETPMIVHCTAGKDRTGVGSALILTALGVPRSVVVSDYAMSEKYQQSTMRQQAARANDPAMAAMAKLPPEVMQVLMRTEPAYIEATLDALTAEYGSVEAYLDKELDVSAADIAALRKRYTE